MKTQIPTLGNAKDHPKIKELPLGFQWLGGSCGYFAIFADSSQMAQLELYSNEENPSLIGIWKAGPQEFCPEYFAIVLKELPETFLYGWRLERSSLLTPLVSDPCHPYLGGCHSWKDQTIFHLSLVGPVPNFDWGDTNRPQIPFSELRIYETHVRSASMSNPVLQESNKGGFNGLLPLLEHVQDLKLNAIELLPIQEFNEWRTVPGLNIGGLDHVNYWGYMPIHPFSAMRAYSSNGTSFQAEYELCNFIQEAHKKGIEVILDVVFNHVDSRHHPLTHLLPQSGFYHQLGMPLDFTGCGNSLNVNTFTTQKIILHALRYMALNWNIDGFRFDLAAVFCRDPKGFFHSASAFLQALSEDSILQTRKLIMEPWDAAGGWLLGKFSPMGYYEWNDKFRDDVRHFIHFSQNKGAMAYRLCGSSDIYQKPRGVNLITSHDGFCLNDLVSYSEKHNEANGEGNRDGHNHNLSCNHGEEGPTSNSAINTLRQKQQLNFLLALGVSLGPIMLCAGDEYGHTHQGNNNPWCQDNEINYLNWQTIQKRPIIMQFVEKLMKWRSRFELFKRDLHLTQANVTWHGTMPATADWDNPNGLLAFELKSLAQHAFIAFNASNQSHELQLPPPPFNLWQLYLTSSDSLQDLSSGKLQLEPKSSALLLDSNYA